MGDIETNCECQYTLTVTDQVVEDKFSGLKDNFNHVPNIHEVDEDDTDEEYTYQEQQTNAEDVDQDTELLKDAVDNETTYADESFYSDDSCGESGASNCSSPKVTDHKIMNSKKILEINVNEEKLEDANDGTVYSLGCERNSTSEERSVVLRQIRTRKNMTFTDEEVRKIERENQLLLRKIMAHQRPQDRVLRSNASQPKTSSSAINRKKLQKKIEYDNMLLLQRIQRTKSCIKNTITKPGCRFTVL